jgi:hypothetical protein
VSAVFTGEGHLIRLDRPYEARREGWKVMDMCSDPLISIYIRVSRQVHRVGDPRLHLGILDDASFV